MNEQTEASNTRWQNINQDSGEKTWLTPKHIIDALGHFDTDPCVPDNMPWRTADRMITKAEDGTTAPWVGRVWLNPPYGREACPFLDRMAHYEGGVSRLSSCGRTRSNGTSTSSRSRIRYCSCADGFASVMRKERKGTVAPRLPRSSHTRQPTRTRWLKAAFAGLL